MDEIDQHHQRKRRRRRGVAGALLGLVFIIIAATQQPAVKHIAAPTANPDSRVLSAREAILDAQPGLWHVTRDVDGDTIDVQQGSQKEIVRFLGLDTPETHDPRKPVQCFGEVAAAHTKALLEGRDVRLEPDPTDSDRDKYHRLLRYVYLPDGTLVNAELIQDGYAFAYTVFPLTKLDDFRALETQAREANRGLWAGCNIDSSKQIEQTAGSK